MGLLLLHFKMGSKVLYADAILAILYVVAAYVLAQSLDVSFWTMFTTFVPDMANTHGSI